MLPPEWNNLNFIIWFFVFVIGACIGSFLNVVVYRLPQHMSVVLPRSHCPYCQHNISLTSLVPILGFFFTLGKCKYCGKKISFQYPLVEWTTAMGTLWLFQYSHSTSAFITSIWLFYTGIALSLIDLKHRILPDKITLPGIFVGFLISSFHPQMGWAKSLIGIFFALACLFLISKLYEFFRKREGMGMGDVKYLAFIGAVLGWDGALFTLFLASILGSLIGIGLAISSRKSLSLAIPFGPFLALAALIVSIWKNELLRFF